MSRCLRGDLTGQSSFGTPEPATYGFSSSETVGRSSHALLKTKFPAEFTELRSHLQNTRYWSGQLRHICKDGHEVLVDSRMQLLGDDTVLEVNRDITQINQIGAELRETQQGLNWLASIVDSSDDAIVSKNLDGIITSWNRGAERVFGYTAEEVIGQPITLVIPVDRRSEERDILTRIRRGERIDHFRLSAAQGWQSDRRFINRFSGQKCRRRHCWSIEDRERYY